MTFRPIAAIGSIAIVVVACARDESNAGVPAPAAADAAVTAQAAFWNNLHELCDRAAAGELLQAPEGDTQIDPDARLVVHFRECGEDELRFPLHVGENRSRTWVFIRHADALELRHDHRHPDGTEESNTWYGARTIEAGTPTRQEFVSERDGMLVGWRVEIEPGERYTYGTIRDGAWRHHLVFDLTQPAEVPPPPWGHAPRPSQRP
jgi:hypothetical protein